MKSFLLFLSAIFLIPLVAYSASENPSAVMVVAVPEGVVLRASPTDSAAKVEKLDVGAKVIFLNRERPNLQEGWRKVMTLRSPCDDRRCIGWARDEDLADESRFKPMSSWKKSVLTIEVGYYHSTFLFYQDGTFKHTYFPPVDSPPCRDRCPSSYRRNKDKSCTKKGKLYRYRDLVWAKDVDVHKYFFIKNQQLCQVYSSPGNDLNCAK